jgi:hypothetical protein
MDYGPTGCLVPPIKGPPYLLQKAISNLQRNPSKINIKIHQEA